MTVAELYASVHDLIGNLYDLKADDGTQLQSLTFHRGDDGHFGTSIAFTDADQDIFMWNDPS